MARIRGFDLFAMAGVISVGVYTGVKFFGPIIIDQLEKDGNLRQDKKVPEMIRDASREMKENEEKLNSKWSEIRAQLELSKEQKEQQRKVCHVEKTPKVEQQPR
ncbi:hypothetical protein BABINDRAFT_169496 [Babjeviella inositovora NRRL Y-12698]|uniref:Uncharacterized protein n=1 Tax=Babjeviella inositovora NRRL Y-12698 TaxID=984486 RepID=A0A1E3QHR1_9ASCO|nr:uncharacterized protein BABINDRAFT_169496 [Babjeviella inositovora NRRL Y-12698]ODQ76974.1 hypothetical protein BABINDRAFT_169496 [Babjeviella inositovora NRRL Y-12698]